MLGIDPYNVEAGPELDQIIHVQVMGKGQERHYPEYSSDVAISKKVISRLESQYSVTITHGTTRLKRKRFYARYGTDPSTATEVLAETLPLATCRLALLIVEAN